MQDSHMKKITPKIEDLMPFKQVQCELCEKKFINFGNLQMHLVRHHKKNDKMEILEEKSKKCLEIYYCPIEKCIYNQRTKCNGRHFTNLKYVKQHFQKVHTEKTFSCTKCGRKFPTAGVRTAHELKCGQIYQCCDCSCNYTSNEALLTHSKRKNHKIVHTSLQLKSKKLLDKKNTISENAQQTKFRNKNSTPQKVIVSNLVNKHTHVSNVYMFKIVNELKDQSTQTEDKECLSKRLQKEISFKNRNSSENSFTYNKDAFESEARSKNDSLNKDDFLNQKSSNMDTELTSYPLMLESVDVPNFNQMFSMTSSTEHQQSQCNEIIEMIQNNTDVDKCCRTPSSDMISKSDTTENDPIFFNDHKKNGSVESRDYENIKNQNQLYENYKTLLSNQLNQNRKISNNDIFNADDKNIKPPEPSYYEDSCFESNLCHIETQTEFPSTLDHLLYSNIETQTCDEFLRELGLSDIQTQTNWSALDYCSTNNLYGPVEKAVQCSWVGAHDKLISAETQTITTQCFLECNSRKSCDNSYVAQQTQTLGDIFPEENSINNFNFQSTHTQT